MKKSAILLLAALFAASLASCGGNGAPEAGTPSGGQLDVCNWGEYIDEDVIAQFEQETGIKVNYQTIDTNEKMYAKLKSGGAAYDVIIPSDYMIARMINEGMLEKLDFDNIPNAQDIRDDLKTPEYDQEGAYSVPYTWGIVGIIYDKNQVSGPVDSWNLLWDETYQGQILMFDNPRDAIGIALKKLGYSFNTTDPNQLKQAAEELKKQKSVVQAYVMDQIFDKMGGGDALIAPYYAGDAVTMMQENPNLAFAVPQEGTNRFVDAMCVPKGARNKEAAEKFINFMSRSDIAQKNIEYIGYSTPLKTVYENLDEETKNGISYPSDEVLAKTETFLNLPDEVLSLYDELWIEIFK